jgi:1-acyl-sn-glycerol-3-phosphate acyltransferase
MEGATTNRSPPLVYRLFRSFFRFLTSIWFREVDLVDDEHIADDAGALFITWHPNGLIDPMLMTAQLPGKVSTLVQHQLFKVPFVGWLFRKAGVIPIGATSHQGLNLGRGPSTAVVFSEMAKELVNGGRVLMFPEEATHGEATVQRVRSGPARLLLEAFRLADNTGQPRPRLVPVGLHYSASQRFRERAAIVLERAMAVPEPPAMDNVRSKESDRAWIAEVTGLIEVDLKRANLSRTSWRERTLIWKGRGLVQAEKQRQAGKTVSKVSYAESILGARRLRAGWEFMLEHEPEVADELTQACEAHFTDLDERSLKPRDVDARPPKVTFGGFLRAVASWLWALVWMFGLVTWGAMIGNYLPYKFQSLLERLTKRFNVDDSLQGSIKVLSSVVLFPLWWLFLSGLMTWFLLDETSPVYVLLASHQLLRYVTMLPAVGVFVFFAMFWPLTARAHLELYARLVRSTRVLQQWRAWNDDGTDWETLVTTQQALAGRLVNLGAALVLPGDPDWVDPPAGNDDVTVVRRRSEGAPK